MTPERLKEIETAEESADRAWIDGARAGWNYAQVDNHAGLTQCIEDRQKGIAESRKRKGDQNG